MNEIVFGDKSLFAVEINYDLAQSCPWLFGSFSYWVNGNRVDGEDYRNLTDIYYSMRWVAGDCGNRQGESLCYLSEIEIFQWISSIICGNELPVFDNLPTNTLPVDVARFNLMFHPANGTDWLLLLSCDEVGLMIRKMSSFDKPMVIRAPISILERPIIECYAFLGQLQLRIESESTEA